MKVATLGQRIEEIRKDRGLSQKELADSVGITRSQLSMFELDKRFPKYDLLLLLAEKLNVSLYYLITGIEDSNHSVNEDLGLSNDTINALKEETAKSHENYMQSVIDILVSNKGIMLYLFDYFTSDYQTQILYNEKEGRYIFGDEMEKISLLRIIDDLSVIKRNLKGD